MARRMEPRRLEPQRLEMSQWVPYPVEMVFAFFANPGNLPHLMPPWQRARIESSRIQPPPERPLRSDPALRFQSTAAGTGSEMMISFRPVVGVPLRLKWLAVITEFVWFEYFEDVQAHGPFAHWKHRHAMRPETQDGQAGTRVMDTVEYALPLGALGRWMDAWMVGRQMRETFAYRQRRLMQILPVVQEQSRRRHASA